MTGELSFGVAAAIDRDLLTALAPRIEAAGFAAFWVNDTPGGDGLDALAAVAAVTERIRLAVGVLPLDRRPPSAIVAEVARLGLPTDRLVLGVGAGQRGGRGVLAAVRRELAELRAATDASIVLAALGPAMRALAATHADGPLLSWLTPEAAAATARALPSGSRRPRTILYTRTTADAAAEPQLETEAARYSRSPHYAAHFEREGFDALSTVIREGDPGRIARYRDVVDELVLRAIVPEERLDHYLRFAELAQR